MLVWKEDNSRNGCLLFSVPLLLSSNGWVPSAGVSPCSSNDSRFSFWGDVWIQKIVSQFWAIAVMYVWMVPERCFTFMSLTSSFPILPCIHSCSTSCWFPSQARVWLTSPAVWKTLFFSLAQQEVPHICPFAGSLTRSSSADVSCSLDSYWAFGTNTLKLPLAARGTANVNLKIPWKKLCQSIWWPKKSVSLKCVNVCQPQLALYRMFFTRNTSKRVLHYVLFTIEGFKRPHCILSITVPPPQLTAMICKIHSTWAGWLPGIPLGGPVRTVANAVCFYLLPQRPIAV